MSGRHDAVLDDVLKGFDDQQPNRASAEKEKGTGRFLEQSNKLASLVSGEIVEKTLRWVDPNRCRMWDRHNRRYDLLNEASCADLIDGFKAQGQQEFPAVVRRTPDGSEHDYEVICGARRHWTVTWLKQNNYPDFQFLIEERELSDEEAFRLSDVENRDRADISDYERAVDYLGALKLYYGGKQRHMANRLEVSEDWLSRYLDLAKLPKSIVKAYCDVAQIRARHTRVLKSLLSDPKVRDQVVGAANDLAEVQEAAQREGRTIRNGQQVLQALQAAGRVSTKRAGKGRGVLAEYQTSKGAQMMTVSRQGRSGLNLKVAPNSGATKKEILDACEKAIDQFIE